MIPDELRSTPSRTALEAYVDPYLGETLGEAQAVREVRPRATGIAARVALGFPVGGYQAELAAALRRAPGGGRDRRSR